jgi:hypothetical protein
MRHILHRRCVLKYVFEGNLEGTRRGVRRHKQFLDDVTEKRRYWNFKEEALDRTLWITRFGRGYEHVATQTME